MGILTPNDLKQALFNLNFYASKDTVYNLIAEYDDEGLGGLTFDAFMRVIGSNPA
jgi:Ca2+-binding EF-hand superfamily protein